MQDRINLDDLSYDQSRVVVQDNKAKSVWVVLGIIAAIVIAVAGMLNGSGSSSGSSSTGDSMSHTNCMFIGYADPNRPLTGQSHCSPYPQYGYRAVYVDRSDIYNTYHFH